jgi:hypothetical protein
MTSLSTESLKLASPCECQATLTATLDDKRYVVSAGAKRHGVTEPAVAHTIGADQKRFDIGWLCPFCGRNTMRSFNAESQPI